MATPRIPSDAFRPRSHAERLSQSGIGDQRSQPVGQRVGVLLVMEKVLANNADLDRDFIAFHYAFKARTGALAHKLGWPESEIDINPKRERHGADFVAMSSGTKFQGPSIETIAEPPYGFSVSPFDEPSTERVIVFLVDDIL